MSDGDSVGARTPSGAGAERAELSASDCADVNVGAFLKTTVTTLSP